MKKNLLRILKPAFMAVLFLIGVNGSGQTTVNYAMSSMGLANATVVGTSVRNTTDSKITFTFAKNSSATNPTYYTSGSAVRLYQNATKGGSVKIMVASGYKITSATVTKASGDGDGPVGYAVDGGSEAGSFSDGTTSNTTGAINATSSVEFYSKGTSSKTRFYLVSFSVTYTSGATTYTVTYDGNGSTGGTAPTDPSSPYASGANVTVLGNTGSLVKTGYTFNNWNTAANGSGTTYAPAATFSIAANTTLYAQWVAPEPSNHATGFAATTSATTHNSITLTWTDATGAQVPDGYLIKASATSYAAIIDPSDGTPESDAALVKNITQGTESVTFSGLTASTTYYFKIWPYTNSGSNIDYKTGSEPQATETTDAAPSLQTPSVGVVYISEVSDASAFNNEFLELYNTSNNIIDLSNCNLQRFSSSGAYEYTWDFPSGAQIPQNGYVLVSRGNNQATFESEWGAIPTGCNFYQGNTNLYFGTGRRWKFVYDDGSKAETVIDDTQTGVASSGNRSIQSSPGDWSSSSTTYATPGDQDGDGSTLPINLLSFTAQLQAEGVDLKWVTSSEVNNDYFTVERGQDGRNFVEVGRVAGAGNSNVERHYSFLDAEMPQATTYYRLRQTDYDGTTTVSKTIQLTPANNTESLNGIFTDHSRNLNIVMNSTVNQQVTVGVYTLEGRQLMSEEIAIQKGIGTYRLSSWTYSSGIYVVRIITQNGTFTEKVFVE